jgi:DNA-binding NtrC family response regulator
MLTCDVRIICAANCSLREAIKNGKFREDLYHRLNGLTLLIPPLRERLEELPALIAAELKNAAAGEGKKIEAIHPEAMRKLLTHEWRGNLRELSHTVRTMTLFCDGAVILPEHVVFAPDLEPETFAPRAQKTIAAPAENSNHALVTDLSLGRAVERHISFVYKQTQQNQRKTAKLLGISRAKLVRHLREMVQERDQ